MDHLGEENSHKKHHDQHKPPMGCWCNGVTNLGEVVQQFLALVEERVQKVIDRKLKLTPNSSSLPHPGESSVSSSLQLCFKGELPETIHTKNNIEDEGAKLELELCNDTGEKAEEISPELKNLKVKILPLDGDFKVEDRHDWTQEEFEMHVVIPRNDKPPLLKGNSEISLKNGFARIHGICFTDISRHMTNGKFRLGAQLIKGLSSGGVVRPAVSEAFVVRVDRLKADRKHPIPLPHDELWRLVNIRKSGIVHRRAVKTSVLTVLDFLKQYHTDAAKLQHNLKLSGKKWTQTVKNAEACSPYPTEQLAAAAAAAPPPPPPSSMETAQGNFKQLPACPVTGAYGVNNTSLASDNLQLTTFCQASAIDILSVVNSLHDEYNLDMQQWLNSFSANDLADMEEYFAKGLTSSSDQKLFNDSSANNPVTRKLVTVCYLTIAAIIFKISAQKGRTPPKKRRKLQ